MGNAFSDPKQDLHHCKEPFEAQNILAWNEDETITWFEKELDKEGVAFGKEEQVKLLKCLSEKSGWSSINSAPLKSLTGAAALNLAERVALKEKVGLWDGLKLVQFRSKLLQLRVSHQAYEWATVKKDWGILSMPEHAKRRFGVPVRGFGKDSKITNAPFGWFYGKVTPDVLEYLLEDVPFNIKRSRTFVSRPDKWAFQECDDGHASRGHKYYEGYWHAYGDAGRLKKIKAMNPRYGYAMEKPPAPPRLFGFIEAFRNANAAFFRANP